MDSSSLGINKYFLTTDAFILGMTRIQDKIDLSWPISREISLYKVAYPMEWNINPDLMIGSEVGFSRF